MPKKKDANEFIKELYDIYGDSYDYSQVNYTGINNKVTLVCKTHDKFEAYPQRLLKGFGCTECTKERIRQEYETEFIMKSKEIYGDLYDYSLVHYVDFYTPVKIICKTHDVFEQSPRTHLKGTGCRQCYLESLSMNTDDFIKRSKEIHGDKFSYEHTVYVNEKTPVIITCKTHGDFEQIPEGHYRCEECCTQCRQEKLEQSFYDRAREVHNNFYSYDKVKFVSTHDDVIITCPVHGDFPQRLSHHLEGRGCPECSNDSFRKTLDEFIKLAREIHGYKYDYSKVEYINNKTKIIIICPEHGEFPQTPAQHLYSMSGCPKCNESHIEKEIRVLIEEYNIEYIYNGRQTQHPWLEGLELDFYIPDIKLAIECQGEQHFMPVAFSGNNVPDEEKQMDFNNILERDERKRVLCKEHNVELIYYSDLDIEYPYEVFTDKNKVMDYIKTKFKEQNKPLHLKNESEESSLKNELTQESEEPSLKILKKIDNNHSNCSCVDCQTSQTPQPIKYRSLY